MPISKLRRATIELCEQKLESSTARGVLLHLCRCALRVMRRIHFELFTEATLQLKPVVQSQRFIAIVFVTKPTESGVLARAPVFCHTMVAKTQLVSLDRYVDGQIASTTVARFKNQRLVSRRSVFSCFNDDLSCTFITDKERLRSKLIHIAHQLRSRIVEIFVLNAPTERPIQRDSRFGVGGQRKNDVHLFCILGLPHAASLIPTAGVTVIGKRLLGWAALQTPSYPCGMPKP